MTKSNDNVSNGGKLTNFRVPTQLNCQRLNRFGHHHFGQCHSDYRLSLESLCRPSKGENKFKKFRIEKNDQKLLISLHSAYLALYQNIVAFVFLCFDFRVD